MNYKQFNWDVNKLRLRDDKCKWFNELIEKEDSNVMIVGIPFDLGVNFRPGARFAPSEIRSELCKFTNYVLDRRTALNHLRINDLGDMSIGNNFETAIKNIYKEVSELDIKELLNIFIGGDHSITYPILKGLQEKKETSTGLILIDSHLDCRKPVNGFEHSGNWMYRVIDEGIIDPKNIIILGATGNNYSENYVRGLEEKGVEIITLSAFRRMGISETISCIKKKICELDIYMSIDIDSIFQSHCPGTSVPGSNGFYVNEIYDLVYEVSKCLNLKYFDLVEINPIVDSSNMTSKVGAEILMNLLAGGISEKRIY